MDKKSARYTSNKVARLIEKYELTGLGDTLEKRWTATGDDRLSLRDLADYFNKELLRVRVVGSSLNTLGRDIDTLYRNLQSDDVSVGVRTDTRRRLIEHGVDVESLESDFVTYQAIRSYLTEFRDASYKQLSDTDKIAKDRESIQRLQSRTISVTSDRLEKLRDTNRIDAEEFEVFLDLQVICEVCGTQYSIDAFLDNRGCECQQ
jgi:hypothetical protein